MAAEAVGNNFSINNMINEERIRQGQPPPWHEEDEVDSTRVSTNPGKIGRGGIKQA